MVAFSSKQKKLHEIRETHILHGNECSYYCFSSHGPHIRRLWLMYILLGLLVFQLPSESLLRRLLYGKHITILPFLLLLHLLDWMSLLLTYSTLSVSHNSWKLDKKVHHRYVGIASVIDIQRRSLPRWNEIPHCDGQLRKVKWRKLRRKSHFLY